MCLRGLVQAPWPAALDKLMRGKMRCTGHNLSGCVHRRQRGMVTIPCRWSPVSVYTLAATAVLLQCPSKCCALLRRYDQLMLLINGAVARGVTRLRLHVLHDGRDVADNTVSTACTACSLSGCACHAACATEVRMAFRKSLVFRTICIFCIPEWLHGTGVGHPPLASSAAPLGEGRPQFRLYHLSWLPRHP